jgi:hypothetical protein
VRLLLFRLCVCVWGCCLTGPASQDIVRKVKTRPGECSEEEKEKAARIELTEEDRRRGGESGGRCVCSRCPTRRAILPRVVGVGLVGGG